MDVKSSPWWRGLFPLCFLDVDGADSEVGLESGGSGWVSPAPKRDRRLPSLRGVV